MEKHLNFTCIFNSSTTWYKYESFDISLHEIHVMFEVTSGKTISSLGEPYWVYKTLNRLSAELGLIENTGVDYKPKWILTEKGKKVLNLIPQEDSCNENGAEEDNTLPNPKRGHKSRMVREALEGVGRMSVRKTQAFLKEKGIEVSIGTIGNILKDFKAKDEKEEEKDKNHLSVLKLLVEGKTIIEAAGIMGISEMTVKRYVKEGKKNGIIVNQGTKKFPKWVFLNEDTFYPGDILIFDDVPPLPDKDILNAGYDDWVNPLIQYSI